MKKFILIFLLLLLPFSVQANDQMARLVIASAGADVTAPTLSTATISADGVTWTFAFSEIVVIGAGGSAGWAVTMSTAGAVTLTYASGSGGTSLVYTGVPTVLSGETVIAGLDYTQPGNGIEDAAGNDLVTIDDAAVTNNSIQTLCNPATNEVGDRTDYTSALTISGDVMLAFLYTADCTGTLEYAHIRHYGNGNNNVKLCVYADDGNSLPNVSDTLIGCSNIINGTANATWYISSNKVTGAVTSGNHYWVVAIAAPATAWEYYRTTTGSRTGYDKTTAGSYASPPATLTGTWGSTASRDYSFFVAIE